MADREKPPATPDLKFRAEAIRTLSGFDPKLIPSFADSLRNVSSIRTIDVAGVSEAAKVFQSFQPIVAPQIAEALSGIATALPSSEAVKVLRASPAFNFAKTFEDLDLTALTSARVAESLQALDLSKVFKNSVTVTLSDLPPVVATDLVPVFERAAEEAVALAEVDDVAEAVDEGIGLRLNEMTPAKRRELTLDVVVLVAAFLLLASWLTQSRDDPKDVKEGIEAFLVCAAAYIRVYWRLIGKLDE